MPTTGITGNLTVGGITIFPSDVQWNTSNVITGTGGTGASAQWVDIETSTWDDWNTGSVASDPQPDIEEDPPLEEEDNEEFFPEEDSDSTPVESDEWQESLESPPPPVPPSQGLSLQEMVNNSLKRNKYDMDKDKEEFYNRKLSRAMAFKHGKTKGDIGLEIECEGTHLFRTPFKFWSCHEDGSLRSQGDHLPVEYVLKAPLPKDQVRPALEYLAEKLKEAKSKIIHSTRTSVHVHVNCQDMTIRELYCYLGLYMILEELLVEWSGPDRAGNLFCLRAKDSDFYVKMLESVLKDKNFKSWRDDYRYAACNVASIPKFGSLEFRSMKGTVDTETIATWVDLLWHIKQVAGTYDNPIEMVEDFVTIGPLPFFRKVFPDPKVRSLFDNIQGMSGKLWDGLRLFRDVAYTVDWKKPLEKKSPEEENEVEAFRYRAGDVYPIPNTDQTRIVEARDHGTYTVTDEWYGSRRSYRIPNEHVLYYVRNEETADYLIVDVRPGPVEFAE